MPPANPIRAATETLDGVPHPAQDESMETWTFVVGVVAIIGTLGGLIGLLMRQNSQAHALIGKRIDDTRHDLGRRIDDAHRATDKRIDDVRADNREVHNDLRAILQALVRPPTTQ